MSSAKLSNLEISDLCRELALLIHAGVGMGDGLYLLAEEEKDASRKKMLSAMAEEVDGGSFLCDAFRKAECFPHYVIGLLRVGEQTGRTEDTLNALARYYEERHQTERQVRSTLTYPAILLFLMLAVIVVLLSKVLPVFNVIYESLGGRLTGIAGGLLSAGLAIDAAMPVICAVLALILVFVAVFALHKGFRSRILRRWNARRGDKGISRKLNNARFAQALSMGFASGLPLEDALELASELLKEVDSAAKRCAECREMLAQGETLAAALGKTELLSNSACRLLVLGMRSGTSDDVMEEIARRMSEEARQDMERLLSRIEPTLVLITSVLVGVILLSVMLPLMNIMSTIG